MPHIQIKGNNYNKCKLSYCTALYVFWHCHFNLNIHLKLGFVLFLPHRHEQQSNQLLIKLEYTRKHYQSKKKRNIAATECA